MYDDQVAVVTTPILARSFSKDSSNLLLFTDAADNICYRIIVHLTSPGIPTKVSRQIRLRLQVGIVVATVIEGNRQEHAFSFAMAFYFNCPYGRTKSYGVVLRYFVVVNCAQKEITEYSRINL